MNNIEEKEIDQNCTTKKVNKNTNIRTYSTAGGLLNRGRPPES